MRDREKEAGFFDLADDFAEERVDDDRALGEHAPELEQVADRDQYGDGDEGGDEADKEGGKENHGRREVRV